MKRALLLTVACLAISAAIGGIAKADSISPQIADGSYVKAGTYPYMVRLVGKDYNDARPEPFCSGTLIAPKFILTAAHCISGARWDDPVDIWGSKLKAEFLNAPGQRPISIVRTTYWRDAEPYYMGIHSQSDLGIMELNVAVDNIAPAQLAPLNPEDETPSNPLLELGYGPRFNENGSMVSQLAAGQMISADMSKCTDHGEAGLSGPFADREICTISQLPQYKGAACPGDSGGALINPRNNTLVGVTSWSNKENCNIKADERETVFARVSSGSDWLMRQTAAPLFGQPAIAQNISVPTNIETTILRNGKKGVNIQVNADGSWGSLIWVYVQAKVGKYHYKFDGYTRASSQNNIARFNFPKFYQRSKKLKNISVSAWPRVYNQLDNGITSEPVAKIWKR